MLFRSATPRYNHPMGRRRRVTRPWGPAQEVQHPRDRHGRFVEKAGGGDWIERVSARIAGEELEPRSSTHEPDWASKLSQRADITDEALMQRYRTIQDLVDRHMHLATHVVHKQDGRWSDERSAIHRQIVDEFYARYDHVPRQRRGLMAGGLGGAGKTTTLSSGGDYDPGEYMPLNPDEFKDEIARRSLVPEIPGHDLAHE